MKWDPAVEYDMFAPRLDPLYSSGVAYFAYNDGRIGTDVVSYDIGFDVQYKSHVRASRKQAQRNGEQLKPLPDSAMRETMVVLIGPKTGPKRAVRCLRKMAALIEKCGLVTGYSGDDDYWEYEFVDPKQAPGSSEASSSRASGAGADEQNGP